jgi:dTDP-glucose pyrophosphorylase
MMTAVVLVGGFGTRLRSVVADRPKVLAPVAGRRFLAYLLDQLADAGLRDVVLCTGYLGDQIRSAFGERWRKLHLAYSQETKALGTGGALRHALDSFPMTEMLVLNGDSYCDVDLRAVIEQHRRRCSNATIVVTEVPDTSRYGAVIVDSSGAISCFAEMRSGGPGLINVGVYVLDRQFVAAIPPTAEFSLERDCFPRFINKGLIAHRVNGRFFDIGTPESFAAAQSSLASDFSGCHGARPYALLDRDGTINVERNYLAHPDQLELGWDVATSMQCDWSAYMNDCELCSGRPIWRWMASTSVLMNRTPNALAGSLRLAWFCKPRRTSASILEIASLLAISSAISSWADGWAPPHSSFETGIASNRRDMACRLIAR